MLLWKNNKLGAKKFLNKPLEQQPISFKGYEGQREALKSVPNWQERFREFTELLINEQKTQGAFKRHRAFIPGLKARGFQLWP